jgi:hypothetical protein
MIKTIMKVINKIITRGVTAPVLVIRFVIVPGFIHATQQPKALHVVQLMRMRSVVAEPVGPPKPVSLVSLPFGTRLLESLITGC